jgi:hypothetical protein
MLLAKNKEPTSRTSYVCVNRFPMAAGHVTATATGTRGVTSLRFYSSYYCLKGLLGDVIGTSVSVNTDGV